MAHLTYRNGESTVKGFPSLKQDIYKDTWLTKEEIDHNFYALNEELKNTALKYGLGLNHNETSSSIIDDPNDLTHTGFYTLRDTSPNAPKGISGNVVLIHLEGLGNSKENDKNIEALQISEDGKHLVYRTKVNNTWEGSWHTIIDNNELNELLTTSLNSKYDKTGGVLHGSVLIQDENKIPLNLVGNFNAKTTTDDIIPAVETLQYSLGLVDKNFKIEDLPELSSHQISGIRFNYGAASNKVINSISLTASNPVNLSKETASISVNWTKPNNTNTNDSIAYTQTIAPKDSGVLSENYKNQIATVGWLESKLTSDNLAQVGSIVTSKAEQSISGNLSLTGNLAVKGSIKFNNDNELTLSTIKVSDNLSGKTSNFNNYYLTLPTNQISASSLTEQNRAGRWVIQSQNSAGNNYADGSDQLTVSEVKTYIDSNSNNITSIVARPWGIEKDSNYRYTNEVNNRIAIVTPPVSSTGTGRTASVVYIPNPPSASVGNESVTAKWSLNAIKTVLRNSNNINDIDCGMIPINLLGTLIGAKLTEGETNSNTHLYTILQISHKTGSTASAKYDTTSKTNTVKTPDQIIINTSSNISNINSGSKITVSFKDVTNNQIYPTNSDSLPKFELNNKVTDSPEIIYDVNYNSNHHTIDFTLNNISGWDVINNDYGLNSTISIPVNDETIQDVTAQVIVNTLD